MRGYLVLLVFPALVGWAVPVVGQVPGERSAGGRGVQRVEGGVVSGRVVDAESGRPLGGATVAITPLEGGAVAAGESGRGAFLAGGRVTTTDASSGGYRFEGVAPGRYRLTVERPGYRAVRLEIELRPRGDSRVSVGLVLEPIALQTLEVRAEAGPPLGREPRDVEAAERARRAAERRRQRRHLSTDVRSLNLADVVEAVTLGETDLFRAIQRLPGVNTRDDYTAELWTRGAAWDQTRVYFDGLPLFHPVHGVGLLSGLGIDGIGAALLHPGVQPTALSGGAAALDLQSRRGGVEEFRGAAGLSLASASLALDGPIGAGRGAWMLAARRSYLDWLTAGIARAMDDPEISVPYGFADLVGRLDVRLDDARALEFSGLWSRDRVTGDVPDILHGGDAGWGNAATRVTFHAPVRGLSARHTLGVSRYGVRVRERTPDPVIDDHYNAPSGQRTDHRVLRFQAGGELLAARDDGTPQWTLGYDVVQQNIVYDGPSPHPVPHGTGEAPPRLSYDQGLVYGVLRGERRWRPRERFEVEAGLRLEAGPGTSNVGPLRVAPRLRARVEPRTDIFVSAGVGRSHQYTQAIGEMGPALLEGFSAGRLWIQAGDTVPLLTTDIATLGVETWLDSRWLASVNAYARRSSGVAVADPEPDPLLDRRLFVEGKAFAYGVEVGARRLAGRWSASGAYSLGVSTLEAAGYRFPEPSDRRHAVDLTSMLRLRGTWRIGAAFTAMSGAPFTRSDEHDLTCDFDGWCRDASEHDRGLPGAARMPAYRSLDLLVDWGRTFRSWELGVYLQLRNALFHDNVATHSGVTYDCASLSFHPDKGMQCIDDWGRAIGRPTVRDRFEPGLPILPLFGFHLTF